MAIRYERLGESPRYRDILIADTEVELLASVPSVEIAEGYAKDTGAKADWVQGIGWKVGGFKRVGDTLVSSRPIVARVLTKPPNTTHSFSPPFSWAEVAAASYTFCKKQFTPQPFTAVQVVFKNPYKDPVTIAGIALGAANTAAASAMVSAVTPTIGGVSMTGMVIPAATGPSVGSNCLLHDGILESDWMPISSIARVDGGSWFGGDLRVLLTGTYGYKQTVFLSPEFPTNFGNETRGIASPGDKITGNPSVNYDPANWAEIGYLRFATIAPSISILECGDSLTRGQKGDGQTAGTRGTYGPLLVASTLDTRIAPHVYGFGGTKSTYFHRVARDLMPRIRPRAAIICAWSPNDGSGAVDASWAEFCDTIRIAIENGIQPILRTPYPCNYSGGPLAIWLALRDRIRAFAAANNFPLADYAAVTEDPANPGQWIPSLTDDALYHLHPNMAGITLAAGQVAAAAEKLV